MSAEPLVASTDLAKLNLEFGREMARDLWDGFLGGYPIDWEGKTVLDFGCHWGYLGQLLLEQEGAAACYGVDVEPWWTEMQDGFDPRSIPNLTLLVGDVVEVPEVQTIEFDIIVSAGTIFLLPPTKLYEVLAWFHDHLRPGGLAAIKTRTFLSERGGGLRSRLDTPLPHLLFSRRTLDRYLSATDGQGAPYRNPSCAATYLALFRRVGFELVEVERMQNTLDAETYERFADKLRFFDPTELRAFELRVLLARPESPRDVATDPGRSRG